MMIKVVQRVVFLHEELMKLPSFPRKALEADLDLYKGGEMGKVILLELSVLLFIPQIRHKSPVKGATWENCA